MVFFKIFILFFFMSLENHSFAGNSIAPCFNNNTLVSSDDCLKIFRNKGLLGMVQKLILQNFRQASASTLTELDDLVHTMQWIYPLTEELKFSGQNLNSSVLNYLQGKYFLKKYGAIAMFFFAFIPNPIFDGIGIVAGLTGYSPLRFLIITFLGRFLRNLLIVYAVLSL
jgi:membrane protein YqaA with SNARE-associated domain